jgi:alpha-tubulin suppressor-like RCC1 family protein
MKGIGRAMLALVATFGCRADTATQVLILVRAEPGFEDATALEVIVERADGTIVHRSTKPITDPRPEPLARVPLVPEDDDASRSFKVLARLLDDRGEALGAIEASGGYEKDQLRELSLWFERSCRGIVDCGRGRTCQLGGCVGACFTPAPTEEVRVARARCGECESCSDRVCVPVAEATPCGCAGDVCSGGACSVARPVATVFADQLQTCARTGNDLYCWGGNRVGQLGTGGSSTTSPVLVSRTGWSEGTAGQDHTCAIKIGGTRSCWGWNGHGQIGTGTTASAQQRTPLDAPDGDPEWASLSAGWFFTCGLTKDRRIGCWGLNDRGACAQPIDREKVPTPTMIDESSDWSAVAAGGFHGCGLKSDGALYCWGLNESGELGVGDSADRFVPIETGCLGGDCVRDWIALASGSFHNCAIREGGEMWCWGGGLNGQLGAGPLATKDSAIPVKVTSGVWRAAGLGQSHSCAIQEDGSLWCWGKNESGELGLGDLETRFEPERVEVPGKNEWIRIGAGREHTCAIKSDRSLWCWGKNANGQLGLGFTTDADDLPISRPSRVCLP